MTRNKPGGTSTYASRREQQNKTIQSDSKKKAIPKYEAKITPASRGSRKETQSKPNNSQVGKASQNSRPDRPQSKPTIRQTPSRVDSRNSKQARIQDQPTRSESGIKTRRQPSLKSVQDRTDSTIHKDPSVSSQHISAIQQHQDDSYQRSIQASQALQHNNPDIADLSDVNRPTKTAERYSELYDNEWTETYEAMTHFKKTTLQESEIIAFLLEILEGAYDFCGKKAETFKTKLIAEKKNHEQVALADLKKKKAAAEIKDLQKTFFEKNLKNIAKRRGLDPPQPGKVTERYANKAVELTWWMHIQNPPVHMVVSSESKTNFDPNIYRAYTKSGQVPEFFVWPPLRLYAEGGVLIKGVVQYK